MTFVVAGVSGNTGRVVAEVLLDAGKQVRGLARDVEKAASLAEKGAELVSLDLADGRALTAALRGAEGAYLLVPPTMTAPDFRAYQSALGRSIVEAVRDSGIPQVVFLSSIGAGVPSGTGPIAGLHEVELGLGAVETTRTVFLRAGYFMENLQSSFGGLEHGVLGSFVPGAHPIAMVATVDIGRAAARLLLEGVRKTEVVELVGPAPVSMNAAAAALSRILGKPIQVAEAPLDSMATTLVGYGLPADLAALYQEMNGALLSGLVAPEPGARSLVGTTSIDEVLAKLLAAPRAG